MLRLLFLILVFSLPAWAEPKLEFSGFGTFGAVYVDSDQYGYRTDFSRTEAVFDGDVSFSEVSNLGVQFDLMLSSTVDIVYQVVYRDQDEFNFDTATNLAFIRYTPTPRWSFRAGRTSFDLFLLSEYRDVGFAYTWAHVPNEVYGIVPYRYIDGADVTFSHAFQGFTFRAKAFVGENESVISAYEPPFAEDVVLDNIYGLALDFESFDWIAKLKYTNANIANESNNEISNALAGFAIGVPSSNFIWPNVLQLSQDILIQDRNPEYFSFGGRYDLGLWSFLGEYSTVNTDSILLPSIKSGYISTIRHHGPHSFYIIYSSTTSETTDVNSLGVDLEGLGQIPGGIELFGGVNAALNVYDSEQNSVALGWRWDIKNNIALKVQWDVVDIDPQGSTILVTASSVAEDQSETVNSFFVSVSFTF